MDKANSKARSSGIAGLDEILLGGFPAGRTYLVEGEPGTGKTTLAMQFLMEGRRCGEKGLYITLSETIVELRDVAVSHGWSLEGIDLFELPTEDRLQENPQNTFFHTSEVELSQTNRVMLEAIEKSKATRIVLDSLSELKLLTLDAVKFRRQVMAMKQFFTSRGATVLLLDDMIGFQHKEQEIQSIVHGVLSLEKLSPGYGAERRRIQVRKLRGVPFKGGYHDFSLRRGGMVVYPRLIASDHGKDYPSGTIRSGIEELDRLWGGAVDRATATLFMGPAGSGKSTLATKYAHCAAENGDRAAIFIFDEGKRTLLKRSKALGIDLEPLIENGKISVTQIDPAEVSPGEFMMLVREEVEKKGAETIVIDSLNGYMHAMPEERFLVVQMHELLSYLRQMDVTTFLVVAQHGLLGSAMESIVDVSYLADNVLLFRYFEAKGAVRQAISVVKRRGGRHERTIRELKLENAKINVGEPLENFQGVLTGTPQFLKGIT